MHGRHNFKPSGSRLWRTAPQQGAVSQEAAKSGKEAFSCVVHVTVRGRSNEPYARKILHRERPGGFIKEVKENDLELGKRGSFAKRTLNRDKVALLD